MKHFSRFLMAFLFIMSFSFTSNAQNENNPWAISVGFTAVDMYPTSEPFPQGEFFDRFFAMRDHYNVLPSISKIQIKRYIGAGFIAEIDGSLNKIKKFGDVRYPQGLDFYSVNAGIQYSLAHVIYKEHTGWFDPFIGLGAGVTWLDDDAAITMNGEGGINFWISDKLAFTISTVMRKAFAEGDHSHFQHFAGVTFAFGGNDSDGDGVYNKNDECPNVAGLPEFNGCPDTDGDGIPDKDDKCPSMAGLPEFNGCPDTDGDGVPNNIDQCPTEAGSTALNGCPDSDNDGIADKDDKCPNEAGPKANNGCPWPDTDGDGVLDKDDKCVNTPGTVANHGCPEVNNATIAKLNSYSKSILFDLNKATIRTSSYGQLDAIAEVMKKYPNAKFHLAGYTDSSGRAAYNKKLSKERAAAVRSYLVNKEGISANRLTSEGYGEANPIATNKTKAGRQQNRRVEIMLEKNK